MGGQKITGNLGTAYRDYLVEHLLMASGGAPILCLFHTAGRLIASRLWPVWLPSDEYHRPGRHTEVGLDQLTADGCVIPRAVPTRPWPGTANLEVAHVWLRRGRWNSPFLLDEKHVSGISSFLTEPGTVVGPPQRLASNTGKSFIGSYVLGMGFVIEPERRSDSSTRTPATGMSSSPTSTARTLTPAPTSRPAGGSSISATGP